MSDNTASKFEETLRQIKTAIEGDVSLRSKFLQEFNGQFQVTSEPSVALKDAREHAPFVMAIVSDTPAEGTYLDITWNKWFLEAVRRHPNVPFVIEHDLESVKPYHNIDVGSNFGPNCSCPREYCLIDSKTKHNCIDITLHEICKFKKRNQVYRLDDWKLTHRGKIYTDAFGVPTCDNDTDIPKNLLFVDRSLMKMVKLFDNLTESEMTAFAKFLVRLAK